MMKYNVNVMYQEADYQQAERFKVVAEALHEDLRASSKNDA